MDLSTAEAFIKGTTGYIDGHNRGLSVGKVFWHNAGYAAGYESCQKDYAANISNYEEKDTYDYAANAIAMCIVLSLVVIVLGSYIAYDTYRQRRNNRQRNMIEKGSDLNIMSHKTPSEFFSSLTRYEKSGRAAKEEGPSSVCSNACADDDLDITYTLVL